MRLVESIYAATFVVEGSNTTLSVLVDKKNAQALTDQIMSAQAGETALYVFRSVQDELFAIAVEKVCAVNLKVHVDADDIQVPSDVIAQEEKQNADVVMQGKGPSTPEMGGRYRPSDVATAN